MIRRSVAGLVLGVALLAGSLAWSGFVALRTVFDADRSRDIAQELLDNDQVRAQLVENLASAVDGLVPETAAVPPELIEAAAAGALENPAVEQLVISAFADTHAAFLGEGDAPDTIDLTPAAEAARTSLVEAAPQLDAVLPAAPTIEAPLPTEHVPDASPLRSFLERIVPVLAIAALAGVVFALFTTTNRPSVLQRAGTWAIGTTAFYLLLGLGLPRLLRELAPNQAEVIAALLAALLRSLLVPAIVLGACGAGLFVASLLWRSSALAARDRTASEPVPMAPRRQRRRPVPAAVRRSVPRPQVHRPETTMTQPAVPTTSHPGRAPVSRTTVPPFPSPHQPAAVPPFPSPHQPATLDRAGTAPRPVPSGSPARPPGSGQSSAPVDPPPAAPSNSVFEPSPVPPPRRRVVPEVAPYAPTWVEGHGWVVHPDDPRPRPANARWVDGVGHVVPGPPPSV